MAVVEKVGDMGIERIIKVPEKVTKAEVAVAPIPIPKIIHGPLKEEARVTTVVAPGRTSDDACDAPMPGRLRRNFTWWRRHAPRNVVRILRHGLLSQYSGSPVYNGATTPTDPDMVQAAKKIMAQYVLQGACDRVHECDRHLVRYFVPWFMVPKPGKNGRFITNLRRVNEWISPPYFKLDSWNVIFPSFSRGMFACEVDISDSVFAHSPFGAF